MNLTRTLLITVMALALPGPADARSVKQRVSDAAEHGPVVYRVDPERGRFPGPPVSRDGEDLVALRAVPVPSVMNGGGFGLSGTDYYTDGPSEAPIEVRRRVHEHVVAPAPRAPLR